jgi:hypothetical protein
MEEAEIIVPDERLELIGGELVPKSQKDLDHETLKQALSERWYRLPRGDWDISVATDVYPRLPFWGRTSSLSRARPASPAFRQRRRSSS